MLGFHHASLPGVSFCYLTGHFGHPPLVQADAELPQLGTAFLMSLLSDFTMDEEAWKSPVSVLSVHLFQSLRWLLFVCVC